MAIISSMTEYEYPLVTMYVISYNQEKFAGAAVEAALLQDYPNLEIIISDDCSTDKTWDEILRIADHYHGPHKLILNRNTYNLGIGEHINRVLKMASGDIIVASAADDISRSDRCRKLVVEFQKSGHDLKLVWSTFREIDEEGNVILQQSEYHPKPPAMEDILKMKHMPLGACMAFKKELAQRFPPMNQVCVLEDHVFSYRATLLGYLKQINDPLVDYRISKNSITHFGHVSKDELLKKQRRGYLNSLFSRMNFIQDTFWIEYNEPDVFSRSEMGKIRKMFWERINFVYLYILFPEKVLKKTRKSLARERKRSRWYRRRLAVLKSMIGDRSYLLIRECWRKLIKKID